MRAASDVNPFPGRFERVYACGISQAGRLLRDMLYLGLNRDEQGQVAFDGMLIDTAGGRRGEFNHRFAQPSQAFGPGFGDLFPFADESITDPLTGATGGLLDRVRATAATPRIIYTNSSAEYWGEHGSLQHIDPTGRTDLAGSDESRIYHLAGTRQCERHRSIAGRPTSGGRD